MAELLEDRNLRENLGGTYDEIDFDYLRKKLKKTR